MELWCLKNSVREFSVLNENLLGSPEAFWRPCVNLSLFIGEDGLEEGAFLPRGSPNNKEQMPIHKVEHGALLSWILTPSESESLKRNLPPSLNSRG